MGPPTDVRQGVRTMKIDDNGTDPSPENAHVKTESREPQDPPSNSPGPFSEASDHLKAIDAPSPSAQPSSVEHEREEVIGGEITLKMEPGQPPKLARKPSQKVVSRPPDLYTDLPDSTKEATSHFEVLRDCHYANKSMGYTEPPLECDCSEAWDPTTETNHACDEHSDCINRATKMECTGDCSCGSDCQNRRFQKKEFANVSVIKTDKKGYGLRTDSDLQPNDFIFEYIGEVIGEAAFRKRMITYDEEGIKHFYFMSLTKGEFVDATRKGNLGRFCNHSCNPNCYVDKWVVGEKLRMGIFAERAISAGEELVFNYNVDRYGADPQPCYCAEPNCVGFIGGKTQSGRSNKLSSSTVEALGLDEGEAWDDAVAKPMRKRKTGEEDLEYISNVEPKLLEEDGVAKVMAELSLTKEKWIAVKLLSRVQRANDERVRLRVIKLHGYRILNNAMKTFIEDDNVLLQCLDILSRFPRITRNKIHDSGIESTMTKITDSENEKLKSQATSLLGEWSKLEMGFRIKKLKRDPATLAEEKKAERRETTRERPEANPRPAPSEPAKRIAAPTGPRGGNQQWSSFRPSRPPRPQAGPLPKGWVEQRADDGSIYYWNALGESTRTRPTMPALAAPPPPPLSAQTSKAASDKEILQNLIDKIVSERKTAEPAAVSATEEETAEAKKERSEERWKSFSNEKKKKLYENTLFPHVAHVMNKYKKYFAKDSLKRLGKTIAKKMVDSDFKHGRVSNPTAKLSSKQEKAVKENVKAYFDKAVKKQKESGRETKTKNNGGDGKTTVTAGTEPVPAKPSDTVDEDVQLSDNEVGHEDEDELEEPSTAVTLESRPSPPSLKRLREENGLMEGIEDDSTNKKSRLMAVNIPSILGDLLIPPPPPPLEADDAGEESLDAGPDLMDLDDDQDTPVNGHRDIITVPQHTRLHEAETDAEAQSFLDDVISTAQVPTPPTTDSAGTTVHEDDKMPHGKPA